MSLSRALIATAFCFEVTSESDFVMTVVVVVASRVCGFTYTPSPTSSS